MGPIGLARGIKGPRQAHLGDATLRLCIKRGVVIPRVYALRKIRCLKAKTLNFRREEGMGNKLYVGGLPYSVTETQLQELFAQHGEVRSAKVITDKFTGRSRGFGFVELGSDEEGAKSYGGA